MGKILSLATFGLTPFMLGCGLGGGGSMTTSTAPDLVGNWQIQTGTVVQGTTTELELAGALQGSGRNVSGPFFFSNQNDPGACGSDVIVTLSGSVDKNNQLTLTSAALANGTVLKIQLSVSSDPTSVSNGTMETTGGPCPLAQTAVTGVEIDPVTGTFTGTMTSEVTSPGTGSPATISLDLVQGSTPNDGGQFPITGTLTYVFGSCTGSLPISGDVNGLGVLLSADSTAPDFHPVTMAGTTTPAATQITTSLLVAANGICSGDLPADPLYSGTLSYQ